MLVDDDQEEGQIPPPIEVEEAELVHRRECPIHCEFCGSDSIMIMMTHRVDGQIVHSCNLDICCKEVEIRANAQAERSQRTAN